MWTGRVRRYDRYNPTHKAMSNLIQGGVAEMMRVVITKIHREMPWVIMCLQVHDSIIFQIPKDRIAEDLPRLKKIMEETPPFTIPMNVDIEYGDNWGETRKYEGGQV